MLRRIALTLVSGAVLYTLAPSLAPSLTARAHARTVTTLAARSGYIVASS